MMRYEIAAMSHTGIFEATRLISTFTGIERLLTIIIGGICIYLGYRLFHAGIFGEKVGSTNVSSEFVKVKIGLSGAAPGTCFALFGAVLLTYSFLTPVRFGFQVPSDRSPGYISTSQEQFNNWRAQQDEIAQFYERQRQQQRTSNNGLLRGVNFADDADDSSSTKVERSPDTDNLGITQEHEPSTRLIGSFQGETSTPRNNQNAFGYVGGCHQCHAAYTPPHTLP